MNRIEVVLRAAMLDLAELRLRWALVGGLAVSARTEPRFTRDVDLVIAARSDADAEQAVHALRLRGYRILALVEQEAAGRLATARLAPPGEDDAGIILDILFASSGIEAEVAEMADVLEVLPGLRVPSPVWAICWHSNCCLATAARARRIKSIWRDYAEWPQPLTSTQLAVPWP